MEAIDDDYDDDDDDDEVIDLSDDSDDPQDVIIYGIDPGSVNCGLCKYNATQGIARELERVSFRDPHKMDENGKKRKEDTDIGNARLIDSVAEFFFKNETKFSNAFFAIEDQDPTVRGPAQRALKKEILAVQHAFQALLGSKRCFPVSPHAIKCHYSDYFPALPGVARKSPEQYNYDKKSAVIYGRKFVPIEVQFEYEMKNRKKKDDAYDAYWVARFAAERLLDVNTGERVNVPPKKRKRSEQHLNKRPRTTKKKRASKKKNS